MQAADKHMICLTARGLLLAASIFVFSFSIARADTPGSGPLSLANATLTEHEAADAMAHSPAALALASAAGTAPPNAPDPSVVASALSPPPDPAPLAPVDATPPAAVPASATPDATPAPMVPADNGAVTPEQARAWSEELQLLERENQILRDKMNIGVNDSLSDIKVDSVTQIRENVLRARVAELEKELDKLHMKNDGDLPQKTTPAHSDLPPPPPPAGSP